MRRSIALIMAAFLALSAFAAFAAAPADRDTVKQVQQALNDAGYSCGTPDGIAGKKTAAAIKQYQSDKALEVTGAIDGALLAALGLAEEPGPEPAEAEPAAEEAPEAEPEPAETEPAAEEAPEAEPEPAEAEPAAEEAPEAGTEPAPQEASEPEVAEPAAESADSEAAQGAGELSPGDVVTFGCFEQDNDPDNGPEAIAWIVLDLEQDEALLISRDGLEAMGYGDVLENVPWENSAVRSWLNGDFLNAAFSADEQGLLRAVTVPAEANPESDTDPGSDTLDRVYLLSIEEANRYFAADADRVCVPTACAQAHGATGSVHPFCWWWLRTTGTGRHCNSGVLSDGSVYIIGNNVLYAPGAVRPAVWAKTAGLVKSDPEPHSGAQGAAADSTVAFGRYEQDGNPENGPEEIEWTVLKSDGDTATLISKYGLDAKAYHYTQSEVTWEKCTLRTWLNEDFLNAAFSADEQERLVTATVTADPNPYFGSIPGSDTQDRVFLLSILEAYRYFESIGARTLQATPYAAQNGAAVNEETGNSWWWLRSPGSYAANLAAWLGGNVEWGESNLAANVHAVGSVQDSGMNVSYETGVVRPVIVLRLP